MKHILFLIFTVFAFHTSAFAAFDLIVTPSKEEPVEEQPKEQSLTGEKLLIMISSGELEKAGMGLTLGLSAAKKGIKV
ncbi:MAG TPA: hypothetical protein EYG82_04180, partial [Sulfurovum sp.]|nr:hypothetical protein [Sulfurovum sp.]